MSKFKVWQEITPKEDHADFKYGRFYKVMAVDRVGITLVNDDLYRLSDIPDELFLTREEYEQAEREKDPFAPGKWAVCVKHDRPLKIGSVIQVHAEHRSYPKDWFVVDIEGTRWGMRKTHFRPATPEEIKEQEMKIMDEKKTDEARAYRRTFTVGGREFYVGQSAWVDYPVLGHTHGKPLIIVGYCHTSEKTILVKPSDACFIIQLDIKGVSTTKPKPHEWKFGDWARDRSGDLGMVISCEHTDGYVWFLRKGYVDGKLTHASHLTCISTAEIPA